MNINGLGNLHDRTDTTYRTSKYAQSYSDFLDKIHEMEDNASGMTVEESTEEESGDEKEMPEEEETRTEVVVKPDGSKILMITVTVGGQEAVTSVELAKPTEGDILGKDITGDVDVKNTRAVASAVTAYENTMSAYSNSVVENAR